MSGNDNKKNNISDEELSLISIIANLENKLEELDHNISLLSKDNAFEKMNSDSNNVIFKRILLLIFGYNYFIYITISKS